MALPSGKKSHIKSIVTYDSATAPIFHLLNCIMSVYLRLSIFATWKSAKRTWFCHNRKAK